MTACTAAMRTVKDHLYVCTASPGKICPSRHFEQTTTRLPMLDSMSRVNRVFPGCARTEQK